MDTLSLKVQAEAYAFRQLVAHLQQRTDVQNIDLMNLAGFCRNCLGKWYVAGARSNGLAMELDEGQEEVYGMPYPEWKKQHQTPATAEQLELFKKGGHGHAKHEEVPQPGKAAKSSACCQEIPQLRQAEETDNELSLRVGILTVSDRASKGEYETGDLSGPEVRRCVEGYFAKAQVAHTAVVPDETADIEGKLKEWAGDVDLILTTGGTGLAPRDVTPEATLSVVDRVVPGVCELARRECSKYIPLASLSRAVCGTRGGTLILNLPGRPKAVREVLAVAMPLFPHAFRELRGENAASHQQR